MGDISNSYEVPFTHMYEEVLTPDQMQLLQDEFARLKGTIFLCSC